MILALVGAMAIQAGTNLINDYYDFRSGADTEQSLGPSMVIQRGLLSAGPGVARRSRRVCVLAR